MQERAKVLDAEPELFDCVMAKQRLATLPYHPPLVAPRSLLPQRFGGRVALSSAPNSKIAAAMKKYKSSTMIAAMAP